MITTKHKILYLVVLLSMSSFGSSFAEEYELDIPQITVTGTREETLKSEVPETVDVIDEKEIDEVKPGHPSELLNRIPGVHVNVTGGEGHMLMMRQPITTKPVYLYLENGIPTRSTGFFNHNALYETNLPQAQSVEVTKGPGTALYGSDAIGGIINVRTRPAPLEPEFDLGLEGGEYGWGRILLSGGNTWGDNGMRGDLNITHTDGWRDKTDYDRVAGTARWDSVLSNGASLETVISGSNIDQQTAGSSKLSEDDYKHNPTKNYYGVSYRDVKALRLSTSYEQEYGDSLLTITPYLRNNEMEYLPNWSFTYDPSIKKTENQSLGLLLKYRTDFEPYRTRLIIGTDLDYSPGSRKEHYFDSTKNADGVYDYYIKQDKIYDYDVTYTGIAPYIHLETSPIDKLRVTAGLRYDNVEYDYDNNMSSGLFRYRPDSMRFSMKINRPEDATVSFEHWSPKIGATWAFNETLNGFISYRNSFRVPSEGQLFRPGSNQASLDLDPVEVNSYELGLRGRLLNKLSFEASYYLMDKTDDLVTYEDPVTGDRYTTNAGDTRHKGLELGADYQFNKKWNLGISYSYTKQTYEDWTEKGSNFSGNELPAAPNNLGNATLNYRPTILNGGRMELEYSYLGSYYMNNENTQKYNGHELFNFRINHFVDMGNKDSLELYARIMNLTDERYATLASYNAYRGREFAPGMERTIYAGINYQLR